MMKIAYIALISSRSQGVVKKILRQVSYWKKYGHEIRLFLLSPTEVEGVDTYLLWKHFNFINPTIKLLHDVHTYAPDCIYMREDTLPVSRFLRFLFWHKKIILEINGNYDVEGKPKNDVSIKKKIIYVINRLTNHLFYKKVRGIVSVSYEIAHLPHFKKCKQLITIPNSIDIDNIRLLKSTSDSPPIRFFFMGTPKQPWHGIDKIIALAKILGNGYEYHLVGPSDKEIAELNPPENVFAYGYRMQYDDILSKCHIAIGTMALHRIALNERSTLKTLEYLAHGFPIITAYTDTVFIQGNPEFVLQLENSEYMFSNDSQLEKIKNFCFQNLKRIVRHDEVREFIDAEKFEKKRLIFMRTCISEK